MAIEKSEFIWHNGKLIRWDDATIHVMSHVVHYGSSVFEGIRCYAPPAGPAIFRATEWARARLAPSPRRSRGVLRHRARREERLHGWLTPVPVRSQQPV